MFQINTMRRKSIVRTAADLLHPELVAGEESVASLLDSDTDTLGQGRLQLEAEHRRKTTFASSLQQSLAQAEAGQQPDQGGMGLEEGLQYVIVTNAENPVRVFSFR